MLGEKFGEVQGRITGQRVIQADNGTVKVETSFQATGKVYGIDTQDLGTYVSFMTAPGVLQGEGHGVSVTKDGESIQWRGHGVGRFTGKGMGVSWRISLTYQTTSQKLAKLNGTVGVGEWEVDDDGSAKGGSWEWR